MSGSVVSFEVVSPPAVEPVSLAEAKQFMRAWQDITDDDELILSLLRSAREDLESRLGKALLTTTFRERRTVGESGIVVLLRGPIREITSVQLDGTDVPFSRVSPHAIAAGSPGRTLTIEYKAGYGDEPAAVPQRARLCVKILASHWYSSREPTSDRPVNDVPHMISRLVDSLRSGREGMPPI